VEDVPRSTAHGLLQIAPGLAGQPHQFNQAAGHQTCHGVLDARLLTINVEPGQIAGTGNHAEDAQGRRHLQRLRRLRQLEVANERGVDGKANVLATPGVVEKLPGRAANAGEAMRSFTRSPLWLSAALARLTSYRLRASPEISASNKAFPKSWTARPSARPSKRVSNCCLSKGKCRVALVSPAGERSTAKGYSYPCPMPISSSKPRYVEVMTLPSVRCSEAAR